MFSKGSCTSTNVKSRNHFRVRELKISDDQWTERKQKKQTKFGASVRGTNLVSLDMGSKDCKIVVRATMETNPLKSACRPTLKLEIVPEIKDITPPKQTDQTGEKIIF